MKQSAQPLGLYIHIPFCKSKCIYCDFYSLPSAEGKMDRYVSALSRHLIETAPHASARLVDTVYFGGGTPSYLGVKRLKKLLKTVEKHYTLSRKRRSPWKPIPTASRTGGMSEPSAAAA